MLALRKLRINLRERIHAVLSPYGVPPYVREAIDRVALAAAGFDDDSGHARDKQEELNDLITLVSWAFGDDPRRESKFLTHLLDDACKKPTTPHTPNRIPAEIKAAIDSVATFVAEWEEDYFGEPFAARTRTARDACALVAWAFKGDSKAKLRFFALLQKGDPKNPEELDPGFN